MPLVTHTTEKQVPDADGGWYWYKPPGGKWTPTWVEPANQSGWPATITINTHSVDVKDVEGEWGPQFFAPDDPRGRSC